MFDRLKKPISLLIIVAFVFLPFRSFADPAVDVLPTNPSGDASFDYSTPNILNITPNTVNSSTILEYDTFSIGKDAAVNFFNGKSGTTLNRVTTGVPSEIFGSLWAQGKIFLINQTGIVFGPDSQVNVNGLLASTLDISDAEFLSKSYNFSKGKVSGSIINNGNIVTQPGGYVALLGSRVENNGYITSEVGRVAIGAGNVMTLSLDKENLISVALSTNDNNDGAEAAIINNGSINAKSGRVFLNSAILNGVFDNAINNSGIIEATKIKMISQDGDIVLISGSSTLASNNDYESTSIDILTNNGDINIFDSTVLATSGSKATVNIKAEDGNVLIDPSSVGVQIIEIEDDEAYGDAYVNIESYAGDVEIYGDSETQTEVFAETQNGEAIVKIKSIKDYSKAHDSYVGGNVLIENSDIDSTVSNEGYAKVKIKSYDKSTNQESNVTISDDTSIESSVGDGNAKVKINSNDIFVSDSFILANSGSGKSKVNFKTDGNININDSIVMSFVDVEGDASLDLNLFGNDSNINILNSDLLAKVNIEGHSEIYFYNDYDDIYLPYIGYLGGPVNGEINISNSTVHAEANSEYDHGSYTAIIGMASDGDINVENSEISAQEYNLPAIVGMYSNSDINSDANSTVSATNNDSIAAVAMVAAGKEKKESGSINVQGNVSAYSNKGFGLVLLGGLGDVYASNVSASGDLDVLGYLNDFLLDFFDVSLENQFSYSSAALIASIAGDVYLGDISSDMMLALALGEDGFGTIKNLPGDISSNLTYLLARNDIGTQNNPIATDTNILAGYSFDEGSIFVDQVTDKLIELGMFLPLEYEDKGKTGFYITGVGASLAANDGIVQVTSNGDMIINSIISVNGGVFLQSRQGSIYAGQGWDPSVDLDDLYDIFGKSYITDLLAEAMMDFPFGEGPDFFSPIAPVFTEDENAFNVIASGYSYFSTPIGTIGVGTQQNKDANNSGQILGFVSPTVTTVNGTQGYSLDLRFGEPPGYVTYENIYNQVWPLGPAGSTTFDNPLMVYVEVMKGSHSALPEGYPVAPDVAAGLTLQFNGGRQSTKIPYFLEDKNLKVYFEILDPFRFTSFEPATPMYYAYHPINRTDSSAFDGMSLDVGAYDFIDGVLNMKNSLDPYFMENEEKKKN